MAELYECYNSINDNKRVLGTWSPALTWIEEYLMPRMIELGWEKVAHIYSEDEAAVYSVNKLVENLEDSMIHMFPSFEEAAVWLKGHVFNSPHTEGSCAIRTSNGIKQIDYRDIYFVSTHDKKTIIQTKEEQIKTSLSLVDFINSVPQKVFMRVHKSYIVNLQKINELKYHAGGYYRAYFRDFGKAYITISKLHARALKEAIKIKSIEPPSIAN
jgi:DNA-binding LytR/AlgR family response regulator